jgi:hypothetical protein
MKGMQLSLVVLLVGAGSLKAEEAVLLRVEDATRQVLVEHRESESERWLAVASGYRDANVPGWMKLGLPQGLDSGELRVRVSDEPSPFSGKLDGDSVRIDSKAGHLPPDYRGGWLEADVGGGGGNEPVIEEADIWAIDDSVLYFYNQYRGMQVVDLSIPEAPLWVASFRYPARGENLYSLGDGRTLIIGNPTWAVDGSELELKFLNFSGGQLTEEDSLTVGTGFYVDSRRYGDMLYLVTREWVEISLPDIEGTRHAPRIHLHTIDLREGAANRLVDELVYDSDTWMDAILTAQPAGLLLSLGRYTERTNAGGRRMYSDVHVLVPGADGRPEPVGVVSLEGMVHDKFKLNFDGTILTGISQYANWGTGAFTRTTFMENFELGPDGFTKVGGLELAPGETLFASRFHEDFIYIVTFLMIDPLFAIDNSNPANPKIAGELEVPGWSDHLEWLDDQLLAIGIEEGQVTVSLFDVADPSNMFLKDREYLGEGTWSEARYDDQAISVYRDEQLMMLPFSTWHWERDEAFTAMQLLSWDAEGLDMRGQILHYETPRRGSLLGDAVVTVSGREVVTTDVSNPDTPELLGRSTLAWDVTGVHVAGNHLLQLEERGSFWGWGFWRAPYIGPQGQAVAATLFVTSLDDPNTLLAEIPLGEGTPLGSVLDGNDLWVLFDADAGEVIRDPWEPTPIDVVVRRYDVSDPLQPVLTGEAIAVEQKAGTSAFEGHVLGDGAVLWTSAAGGNVGIYWDYWIGPWYGGFYGGLSALVCVPEPDGRIAVSASFHYGENDGRTTAGEWLLQSPFLFGSTSRYVELESEENPELRYEIIAELIVIDLSEPNDPVELPKLRLPARLNAVHLLPTGKDAYLYFSDDYRYIDVWGWDTVQVFPIFAHFFFPEERDPTAGTDDITYSSAWMPPLNVRIGYSYNGNNETRIDVWQHDFGGDQFLPAGELTYPSNEFNRGFAEDGRYHVVAGNRIDLYQPFGASGIVFPKAGDGEILSSNLMWSLYWESMTVHNEYLYVPAGLYGVEPVEIDWIVYTQKDTRFLKQLEETASDGWRTLPAGDWQRVAAESEDAAGRLVENRFIFLADTLTEPDTGALDAGDLWRNSEWLGWYRHETRSPGWIWHERMGHLAVFSAEDVDMDGLFFYGMDAGYFWTHREYFPWAYHYAGSEWLWHGER